MQIISVHGLPDLMLPDATPAPTKLCHGCTGTVIQVHPASPDGEKRCAICCRVLASLKKRRQRLKG